MSPYLDFFLSSRPVPSLEKPSSNNVVFWRWGLDFAYVGRGSSLRASSSAEKNGITRSPVTNMLYFYTNRPTIDFTRKSYKLQTSLLMANYWKYRIKPSLFRTYQRYLPANPSVTKNWGSNKPQQIQRYHSTPKNHNRHISGSHQSIQRQQVKNPFQVPNYYAWYWLNFGLWFTQLVWTRGGELHYYF